MHTLITWVWLCLTLAIVSLHPSLGKAEEEVIYKEVEIKLGVEHPRTLNAIICPLNKASFAESLVTILRNDGLEEWNKTLEAAQGRSKVAGEFCEETLVRATVMEKFDELFCRPKDEATRYRMVYVRLKVHKKTVNYMGQPLEIRIEKEFLGLIFGVRVGPPSREL